MDLYPFFEKTAISDTVRSSNMDKLNRSEPSSSRDAVIDPEKRRQEFGGQNKREKGDEARDHFESLKTSTEIINNDLERKNVPYRVYLYREFDEVFINLERLDGHGEIVEIKKKNITHQEFADLIRHLENGEGLFFDKAG